MDKDLIDRLRSGAVWVKHANYAAAEPEGYSRDSAPHEAADALEVAARMAEQRKDCRLCDYYSEDGGRRACVAHLTCVDGGGFTTSAAVQLWGARTSGKG
jgi:hypothetical protein